MYISFRRWLCNRDADLIWSSIVMVAVLVPLAALTLDVPRYFILRSRLQLAADAAAEAAAQCVDIPHFQRTGETMLDEWCLLSEPGYIFVQIHFGFAPGGDTITVQAEGTMPVFFALTPRLTLRVEAQSRYRVIVK
jgi:hypothetical protein